MTMNRRQEILRATSRAATLFDERHRGKRTSFDIVGAVLDLGIPLLFRPLNNLLGAVVVFSGGRRGIIVTTKRDLHVQRFTLAHELGHILLGHDSRFDSTIELAGKNASNSRPAEEVAADTFASELLCPKSLLLDVAKKKTWNRCALQQPEHIYQLSLRLGISYQAACWSLVNTGVLKHAEATKLTEYPLASLKQELAKDVSISDPWANVWELSKDDSGTFLEAGPNDLFVVRVQDNSSSGYIWKLIDVGEHVDLISEEGTCKLSDCYGTASNRLIYFRFTVPGVHRLVFEHVRPWNQTKLDEITIEIDDHGKELLGLARREKLQALSQVA